MENPDHAHTTTKESKKVKIGAAATIKITTKTEEKELKERTWLLLFPKFFEGNSLQEARTHAAIDTLPDIGCGSRDTLLNTANKHHKLTKKES